MNVLDNYNKELINLGDPYEIDDDLYYCKFNYDHMPFIIKTNKICVFKTPKKNKENYVNISITSKEYLLWFESFYNWCIHLFSERSEDWFNDPLSVSDVEFSFTNPLKSNIRDNCFDIQCITDENRLHIVDTKDNVCSLEKMTDCNIIPTFHIKGVKFNSSYFTLDIELNNILVILDDLEDSTVLNNSNEPIETNNFTDIKQPVIQSNVNQPIQSNEPNINEQNDTNISNLEDDLNEVSLPTDDLEEMNMDIESNGFYEIYEMIDEKIRDNIIQNLQKIFNKKKIKVNMELIDIFDEEE